MGTATTLAPFVWEERVHHPRHPSMSTPSSAPRVAITGSSGLIGSALAESLRSDGHRVVRVVRGARGGAAGDSIAWDPARGAPESAAFDGMDAVVHLAGENVSRRWTVDVRVAIRASRVDSTRALATALSRCARAPRVLAVASAVGYYGDRGDELLDESSPPGGGFLADVVRAWEAAAAPASAAGIRVVNLRFGVVLSPRGGMIAKLLPAFQLGAGGRIGDGRQWLSWVSRTDVARAIRFVLGAESLGGAVNVTSPAPVTNAQLTAALGRVLHRPTVATVPPFALRLLYGTDMVDETVLASQRAVPRRLEAAGFRFEHAELEPALRAELGG